MLAIDHYYYIDVHIFDSKLVKNAFVRCRVLFRSFRVLMLRSTLSINARRCLKSLEVKSEAQILFKLSRFGKWNTHTVQQTLGITKTKTKRYTKNT